jgi:hypothetical protein
MPADPFNDAPFFNPHPPEERHAPTGPVASRVVLLLLLAIAAIAMSLGLGDPTPVALLSYILVAGRVIDTAFWLRHHDPNQARGHTCFWLYLAYAGSAAAIKASSILLLLAGLIIATGQQPPIESLNHLMAVMVIGWLFSCMIGWVGIALSLARRIPVYIIPDLKQRCGGEFQNMATLMLTYRGFNRTVLIVTASLATPFLFVGFLLLILQPQMPGREWMAWLGFALLNAGAVGGLLAVAVISARVAALNPAVAWPEYLQMRKA